MFIVALNGQSKEINNINNSKIDLQRIRIRLAPETENNRFMIRENELKSLNLKQTLRNIRSSNLIISKHIYLCGADRSDTAIKVYFPNNEIK